NIGMPLQGTVTTADHVGAPRPGAYVIRASYADKGSQPIGSLTSSTLLLLRNPKIQAEEFEETKNIGRRHIDGSDFTFVTDVQNGSYLGMKNVDLTAISKVWFRGGARQAGSRIEIRQGAPDGKLLATAAVPVTPTDEKMQAFNAALTNPGAQQDLYLVFRNNNLKSNLLQLDWVYFDNGQQTVPNQ
ncbi:MAG: carbohydrate-binding protein, partial [Adhaeribacter sp.]|nr:carbohydrate-binding protein [Adhaeribacter sp.]